MPRRFLAGRARAGALECKPGNVCVATPDTMLPVTGCMFTARPPAEWGSSGMAAGPAGVIRACVGYVWMLCGDGGRVVSEARTRDLGHTWPGKRAAMVGIGRDLW